MRLSVRLFSCSRCGPSTHPGEPRVPDRRPGLPPFPRGIDRTSGEVFAIMIRNRGTRTGLFRAVFAVVQVAFLGTSMLVVPAGALPANPSADLDQCANQPPPSSPTDRGNPADWVNGHLSASKSTYPEGGSM